ncbi:MAG: hypothetical protein B6D64_05660 [Bacteroidetes bacterium 4484_276]|nr:MAG: hypothetical protein B6D64_05660 [Bacteroidetes bacterium 4484_276]OYT12858.1 MAG: hypothetical protein B6I19_08130 [Bacteroidetes bacterium 4572_114]
MESFTPTPFISLTFQCLPVPKTFRIGTSQQSSFGSQHLHNRQLETRNLKHKAQRAKSKAKEAKHNLKLETCETTGVGCRVSGEGSQAQPET